MTRRALLLTVLAAGCVRDAVPARFLDRPIVTRSDDARPIPEPAAITYYIGAYLPDALVFDPLFDALDHPARGPARDVNALDEVPDSTWFTNRIGRVGVPPLSPAEAATGPDTLGPPVLPFSITSAKAGGGNPGFIATDARGIKYLVKFDTPENPRQQTATDPIVDRIMWAVGYHVPVDFVVDFRRDQLAIAPKLLAKGKITDQVIDAMLKDATKNADGSIRTSVSQILDGTVKGGWPGRGTRGDDPNDHVPHQDRRVVRGLRVISAWLDHTDVKLENTLDMYVGKPGAGHLEHYLVDFGEAFSGHQSEHKAPQIGFEYQIDFAEQGKALVAFGLWHRPWESITETRWKQVGYFTAQAFDPEGWRPRYPYAPFALADAADKYWAAKLVMKFDRPTLAAIVATGHLGDAEAEAYVVDVLMQRRAAIGRAFLDGVTPFDELAVTGGELCGVDLARRNAIAADGVLVADGQRVAIAADGHACMPLDPTPGYHVARVSIERASHATPPLEVHYIGGREPRVIGLVR